MRKHVAHGPAVVPAVGPSERGLCPRNPSRGAAPEGGAAPLRLEYGAKTPKARGAA